MIQKTPVSIDVQVTVRLTATSVTALNDLVRELKRSKISYDHPDGTLRLVKPTVLFKDLRIQWLDACLRRRAKLFRRKLK
jgi:hypothetical protein